MTVIARLTLTKNFVVPDRPACSSSHAARFLQNALEASPWMASCAVSPPSRASERATWYRASSAFSEAEPVSSTLLMYALRTTSIRDW